VLAVLTATFALAQHRVRLADACGRAEVDTELASCHERRLRLFVEREVELDHVDARLAEESERAPGGLCAHERHDLVESHAARISTPLCLQACVLRRDHGIEPGARPRDRVGRHFLARGEAVLDAIKAGALSGPRACTRVS